MELRKRLQLLTIILKIVAISTYTLNGSQELVKIDLDAPTGNFQVGNFALVPVGWSSRGSAHSALSL